MNKVKIAVLLNFLFSSCLIGHVQEWFSTIQMSTDTSLHNENEQVLPKANEELFQAVGEGNVEKAAQALRHGANVNALVDKTGKPLDVTKLPTRAQGNYAFAKLVQAARQGDVDAALMACRMNNELDWVIKPIGIDAPLDRIKESVSNRVEATFLYYAVANGQLEMVEFLLKQGAGVNLESLGRPPLHLAVVQGNIPLVMLLIRSGANVRAESSIYGDQAIHLAAGAHDVAMIKTLIEQGADVNAERTMMGGTPLHVAAEIGNAEVVGELIMQEADLYALDWDGMQPIHRALRAHNRAALEVFAYFSLLDVDFGSLPTSNPDRLFLISIIKSNKKLRERLDLQQHIKTEH